MAMKSLKICLSEKENEDLNERSYSTTVKLLITKEIGLKMSMPRKIKNIDEPQGCGLVVNTIKKGQ